MKVKITLIVVFLLAVASSWAKPISEQEARSKALAFGERLPQADGGRIVPQMLKLVKSGNQLFPEYYVYNVADNRGYIIVAGDDRMSEPIPIYSLNGSFDPDNQGSPLQDMLASYAEQVKEKRQEPESTKRSMPRSVPLTSKALVQVGPLLGNIIWDQVSPYNDQCPRINGNRCYTGCGATAAAMVMKYYAYPTNGVGTVEIKEPEKIVADLSKANYQWDLMTPTYGPSSTDAQRSEVAKLMMNVGAAFGMNYKADASGMGSRAMINPLVNNFLYHSFVRDVYRVAYSDQEWLEMLKREIDLKRPVMYSGTSAAGAGHIFVCDGYDSDGRVHFNFGWGGYENAYMQVKDCKYLRDNQLVIGVSPNTLPIADADMPAPQVAMTMPLTTANHSPALGATFSIGTKVINFNARQYKGEVGVALFEKASGRMIGTAPLAVKAVDLKADLPRGQNSDVEFSGFSIPKETPDGSYVLRLMVKERTAWHLAQYLHAEMSRDLLVEVKDGSAQLSYPMGNTKESIHLELIKPIEVAVASNRATVSFSVGNADEFYKCTQGNVFVLVAPNNSPIPTISRQVTVSNLESGLVQDFTVSGVPLPSGVTSCRIYIGYNRLNGTSNNAFAAPPMGAFANNFKSYTIPQETVLLTQNFVGNGNEIPVTFKKYLRDGTPSNDAWKVGFLSKAAPTQIDYSEYSKLVTHPILIKNDNVVLEWQMGNMYSEATNYKLYVSDKGQGFENFVEPAFYEMTPNNGIARLYLGGYAGKEVCLAFESEKAGQYCLMYYKLLEIKTPKDISLEKVLLQGTALANDVLPVKVVVKNNSAADVTQVTASYMNGSKKVEQVFTTKIAFNNTQELTFDQPFVATGKPGDITNIKVRVDITGEDPSLLSNNETEVNCAIASFFPKKSVLFYKTSKVPCGGCEVTITAIDDYEHAYPESAAGVELWRKGSIYWIPAFNNLTEYGSTPRFFMNEKEKTQIEVAINEGKEEVRSMNPPADVWAEASFDSEESREMKIKITASFAMPTVGTYKVGAILIENNVIDVERQISGQEADVKGDKLVKNHIPLAMFGGPSGEMTLVNPLAQEYDFDATYTIPAQTAERYRKDNIQIIAVLYNPKGEIINSSLDSYYLKLPKTEGLTFKAVSGYPEMKFVYDIVAIRGMGGANPVYRSVSNYRATILRGGTYKFTIQKDATWSGKMPKVIVNKAADYNRNKEEVLLPDENGVYTLTEADRHYFMSIEQVEVKEDPFTVKHKEKVLADGATVEIKEYSTMNGDMIMKAEFEVTKNGGDFSIMRISKEVISQVGNSYNDMCWVDCVEEATLVATSGLITTGVPQTPYAQHYLNYHGEAVAGTSTIKYTFDTNERNIDPLTVTVNYVYDEPTEIKQMSGQDGLVVYTTAHQSIEIHSDEVLTVHIRTIDGRLIKSLTTVVGTTSVDGLPRGVYLVNGSKVVL